MDNKYYKSRVIDRWVYSLIAIEIILPSLWAMLYGIDKRSYNWPMIPVGALICSYMVYILQKFFTYKIMLSNDGISIYSMGKETFIRYEDIIEIDEEKNACYIIDIVERDGSKIVRGTDINAEKIEGIDGLSVDVKCVPALQKAFIDRYDELIDGLFDRCKMSDRTRRKKMSDGCVFVRSAIKKGTAAGELFGVIFPYLLMAVVFFMGLIEFSAAQKGHLSPVMTVYLKLIFPCFVIISLFVFVLKYIDYIKSLMKNDVGKEGISGKNTLIFLLSSILVSAGIIAIFFAVLGKVTI